MKQQDVTLRITVDDDCDDPSEWDFVELFDLNGTETVQIMDVSDVAYVPEETP